MSSSLAKGTKPFLFLRHCILDFQKFVQARIKALFVLTVKAPTTTAADDIHEYFFSLFFQRK